MCPNYIIIQSLHPDYFSLGRKIVELYLSGLGDWQSSILKNRMRTSIQALPVSQVIRGQLSGLVSFS